MATREQIVAQIDEIDARLNAGTEQVRHGDTSLSYNLGELRKRRAELNAKLAAIDGAPRRPRHIRTYSTKGL